jgi:UrcA family protein
MLKLTTLAVAFAISAPALANENTIRIKTRNVDFADAASVDQVHRRVVRAAERLCTDNGARRSLIEAKHDDACIAETVDRAIALSGAPSLVALHQGLGVEVRYTIARAAPDSILAAAVAAAAAPGKDVVALR